ncbi:LOW QUALITY PROTEIN: cationic amino acid transporter 4, vacuolar-like [Durio zibethinus]|uniref:LOW QUALITY PROTEIN: cationic amino acid transporter 4, vacuolar-like n=1 Tax=Durio zibethinus TaxID=66656 RepID=A0A6P5WT14_DURZI|nr:LOW QUALITY PROTEIN: cationic amino acid transporter 4, vacuolar-like [Durio zibethinus]
MPNKGGVLFSKCSKGLKSLVRRKQVDSVHARREGHQLARKLSALDLTAIGVGTTIGAGVYVLVGTVAREHTGPALTVSFLIAGLAAALSAFCYAELASRCPSAGSAYHYTYICIGESVAWLIGWSLILEYTIGGSAIARGISPNLALIFGGEDKLPDFLVRHTIPQLGVVVDPCAAVLVVIVTVLLCAGIKESSLVQTIVTTVNVCAMLFVIIAGGYLACKTGWVGYEHPSRFFPFGVNGMLAGSAVVFFSYIGFDAVTGAAEEAKRPLQDLPLGIGMTLSLCCILYMLVSVVIVGLVPYYSLNPDTPISSAFSANGMQWAAYIVTAGAVTALCASLMGSLLPQPRLLMAMARDGLLPSFFSDISTHTQVPVKSTVTAGTLAAVLALFMDVSQLSGMVSVGTLLAFTVVAISILILRYAPPDEMPLPSSLQESIGSVRMLLDDDSQGTERKKFNDVDVVKESSHQFVDGEASIQYPLIQKQITEDKQNQRKRRKIAVWNIALFCIGVLVLTSAASAEYLPRLLRFSLGAIGAAILLCSLIVLACLNQDEARHSFGHTGGFLCPFVPFLPAACILVNVYLLISLGAGTWIRVSIWLMLGALVYIFYGWSHSSLTNAVYVPIAYLDEIYRASSSHQV